MATETGNVGIPRGTAAPHRTTPLRRLPLFREGPGALPGAPLKLPAEPFLPPEVPAFDRSALRLEERHDVRASSYTIYVDLPGNDDEVLLIHGYTGAFDKVSRPVAAYLRSLEVGPAPKPLHGEWSNEPVFSSEIPNVTDAVRATLKKRGYLTSLTVEEEEAFFTKMAARRHLAATRRAPAYVLVPTYQCNLRCPYCFQDHFRTDPAHRPLLRTMSAEMADRILRAMAEIEAVHAAAGGNQVERQVTLFGGEPLLAESRSIVEYLWRRLSEAGPIRLSAISNATELDHYRDLLGPDKISFLQVTLDGPPEEHDKRRVYADGSGSFERIAKNIDLALGQGVKISLRMNIDRKNIALLPELGEELERRGWTKSPHFSAYVAPIHGEDRPDHSLKTTFNTWELYDALSRLKQTHPSLSTFGGQDDGLVRRLRRVLDERKDPLPILRSDFCGAHTTMYIFDAFGDIYACWERMGDQNLRIGSMDESGQPRFRPEVMEAWRHRSVTSSPVCRKCRYASYCGGGCAVLAEGQNGTIHSNYCDGFGKRFRQSAMIAYQEHLSGATPAGNADRVCDL